MSANRICRIALKYRFLLLAIAVTLCLVPAILYAGQTESSEIVQYDRADVDTINSLTTESSENVQYDRADADTIKSLTREILSSREFMPNKTFGQWLMEKLNGWRGPKLNFGHGWIGIICWILLIWCILTLIAILAHFVWTIVKIIRPKVNLANTGTNLGNNAAIKITSYAQLYQIAQELASEGKFKDAIGIMTAALLRWLDFNNVISFHDSKTNGDYIREYPADYSGMSEFKKFIRISDQTLYGNLNSDNNVYDNMNSLKEHIHNSVTPKE